MAKLSTLPPNFTKRVMVYGPPKSGKSQLAATLAQKHQVLWLDVEQGGDVLWKLPEAVKENIDYINIKDSPTNIVALATTLLLLNGHKGEMCHRHSKFRCQPCTVLASKDTPENRGNYFEQMDTATIRKENSKILVIDSLTQIRTSLYTHISKGDIDYKFEYDDWARLNNGLDQIQSTAQTAGWDIVIISHEDEVKMTDGKETKIVPIGATRNNSRNLAKFYTDLVYCTTKNGKHVAYSKSTQQANLQTGSRSDVDLTKYPEPTLLPFFEHRLALGLDKP